MRVEEIQLDVAAKSATDGVVVRRTCQKHVLTFLMVFGPGLIVMEADNDAGAVYTYVQAGGQYGLHLLLLLAVLLPICYFVQEMVTRLGIATGNGHAAMIYERFGKWGALLALRSARRQFPDAHYGVRCGSRWRCVRWASAPISLGGRDLVPILDALNFSPSKNGEQCHLRGGNWRW